ncbi:MAG: acyl-CoA synthetase [Gammaproteobacteria bacterium]|nr:acyl-CoA synthetase [Gammaproteobacteria bacterium]
MTIRSLDDVRTTEARSLADQPLPASTYELLRNSAKAFGGKPALSFFLEGKQYERARSYSYRELFEQVTRCANLFGRLGVGRGDVVAYLLPNLPETHFVLWGGEAAGIAFAVNPLLEPAQVAELLDAAQAKVLVTIAPLPVPGADLWDKLLPFLPRVRSLRHILRVDLAEHLDFKRKLALKALRLREKPPRAVGAAEVHDFHTELARESGSRLNSERRIRGDEIASYFCTGGTTGSPKIATRTHRNEIADTWATGSVVDDGVGLGKVVYCGLPLFHVNATLVTGLLPFLKGAHVVLGSPQGYRGEGVIENFWKIVQHYRVNFFSGVPTLYAGLLQVPLGKADVSSLEFGLCGAAPMPLEVFRRFEQTTGIRILEGYGLTEGTCVSSVNPPEGERRIGSIGLRIPHQDMKVLILDDSGRYQREAEVDEPGAIAIAGPNVFAGYLDPAQNAQLWIDCGDERRWLNTGDLGRQDADGYFWLTGRKKELIIRGGHNIDPASIEEPLHRHPQVALAAAVGRPDAHAGELPVAYVQLKPGASVDEQALLAYTEREIGERAARPKAIHIIDPMPLTPVGKIYKPALKLREVESLVREELAGVAGLQVQSLQVRQDGRRGIVAEVRARAPAATAEALRASLGRYAFAVDLNMETGAA